MKMELCEVMKKFFHLPAAERELEQAMKKPYEPIKPGEPFQIISTPTGDGSTPFCGVDLGRKEGDETVWAFIDPETGKVAFKKGK
jgi:hypothetical protein